MVNVLHDGKNAIMLASPPLSLRSIVIYQIHDLFEDDILAYNSLEHPHFPNKFPDLLVNTIALGEPQSGSRHFQRPWVSLLSPALPPR